IQRLPPPGRPVAAGVRPGEQRTSAGGSSPHDRARQEHRPAARPGVHRLAALVHPREPAGGMFGRGRVRGSSGLGQGLGRVRGGRLARGTDRGLWTDHGFDERPRGLRQAPAGQPALSDAVSRTVRGAPRFRFPHPLVLLVLCVLAAAILTWVLAPGEYERRADPAAQREVVVAGTYHAVSAAPVGPFQALVAVPKGMSDAASIIFYV